jgi:hypothetical protein
LRTLLQGGTNDHILDFSRFDTGSSDCGSDRICG